MNSLETFFSRKDAVIMVAYGGVGEFVFQLDLAARIHQSKKELEIIFLAKARSKLFSEMVQAAQMERYVRVVAAQGIRYALYVFCSIIINVWRKITIINSFNSLFYRFPTKFFYGCSKLLGARVVVAKHVFDSSLPYEQVIYFEDEMVWQRNERITELITKTRRATLEFPLLSFSYTPFSEKNFFHIHPVASIRDKSYPSEKLEPLLLSLAEKGRVILTMTPREESWYMTDRLRAIVLSNKNILFKSTFFNFQEMLGIMKSSSVFCTVNTGLVWVAVNASVRTVVLDYQTEYEWNPEPYELTERLLCEIDQEGRSTESRKVSGRDGDYFAAIYHIEPEVVVSRLVEHTHTP